MYESYYQLKGKPFQLSPDPFFFFGSSTHKRALAYLKYGLSQGEGFIIVTGDVGTGKSTLVRTLFGSLAGKDDIVAAELINTQLDSVDLLKMVAATFGLAHKENDKSSLLKNLENYFIARHREGKRCMLVIDEAQNLPFESIEELRMLSNLFYEGDTLLQIFLLGQSEFREMIHEPEMEQLKQRVTASYHLAHLDAEETQAYIEHRLHKVGWKNNPGFTAEAFQMIFDFTEGVPRRINTTCDRLLLYGFLEEKNRIDGDVVKIVTDEIESEISAGKSEVSTRRSPQNRESNTRSGSNELLTYRIEQLEKELQEMRRLFNKEREFMRKVVQISLNFDE